MCAVFLGAGAGAERAEGTDSRHRQAGQPGPTAQPGLRGPGPAVTTVTLPALL